VKTTFKLEERSGEKPMRTILIAQHDVSFAEQLATELRHGGYRVIVCSGPPPPQRCIRCDTGYCPLTDGADLMIYDPGLIGVDAGGRRHYLAVDSALAEPEVPLLLAWSPESAPDEQTLRAIQTQAPGIQVAARSAPALLRQIEDLLVGTAVSAR
jgi:hypothetical protein